jgi:hypothetical protein
MAVSDVRRWSGCRPRPRALPSGGVSTRTTIGARSSRSVAESRRDAAGDPARTMSISLRLAAPSSPRRSWQCRVQQAAG